MRNLKRVLSLALASAMLLGMMVIGAGAADKKAADLTDIGDVKNTEAVNLMVDLGIITGKPDGSYAPAETVDRATMSTLIFRIMMGTSDASGFKGVSTPLTDVKGNWAEGYINYCYSVGIVAGTGDNTYNPAGKVAVVSAAKMLLVALGYDATASKYQNDAMWSVNIMRDAQKAGLLDGITQASTDELTRDNAAQMIFNALFAGTVTPKFSYDMGVKYLDEYTPTGTTIGKTSYKLNTVTAVVVANNSGKLSSTGAAKDTTNLEIITSADTSIVDGDYSISSTAALLGHQVRFYTNSTTHALISTSVSSTGKTVTYTAAKDYAKFITDSKLNMTGAVVSTNYGGGTAYTNVSQLSGDVLFINSDGSADKSIEYVVNNTYTFGQVSNVNTTKGSITILGGGFGTRSIKDVPGAEGLKKGDFVVYNVVGSTYQVAAAKSVAGTPTSKKTASDGTKSIAIDGKSYNVAADVAFALVNEGGNENKSDAYFVGLDLSKASAGTFYLDYSGKIAAVTGELEAAKPQYAVITNLKVTPDAWDSAKIAVEAKVILADGTRETLTLSDTTATTFGDTLYDVLYAANLVGAAKLTETINAITNTTAGQVYAYTMTTDGKMVAKYEGGKGAAANGITTWTVSGDLANNNVVATTITFHADVTKLSKATAVGSTAVGFVSGKPALHTALYANDATTFVYYKAATSTAAESILGYTSYEKAPNYALGTSIDYIDANTDGYAEFVLVRSAPAVDRSDAQYAFITDGIATITATGKQYAAVIDGELKTVTVGSTVTQPTANTLYTYVNNSTSGLDELVAVADDANYFTIAEKQTVTNVGSNYAIIGGTLYYYGENFTADDLTVFDSDKNFTPMATSLQKDDSVSFVFQTLANGDKSLLKAYVVTPTIAINTGDYTTTVAVAQASAGADVKATVTVTSGLVLPANYKTVYTWTTNDDPGVKKTAVEATTGDTVAAGNLTATKTYTCTITLVDRLTGAVVSTGSVTNTVTAS